MKYALWLLPAILIATALSYLPGLSGPFLFDDTVHITQNAQVKIDDLTPTSLGQAWRSSLTSGFGSRPLAQVSFGINHAFAGLDARHFKATNLAIHLLVGLLIFALSRELGRALGRRPEHPDAPDNPWPAILVTGLWLLHPINLTPVLYVVQRMTSLSALFVVAGLWCHVRGRLLMSSGRSQGFWLALAGLPLAAVGALAKESAVLYPLLVLALEWTLLRHLLAPGRRLLLAVVVWVPLILGAAYLLTHLGLLTHARRPFTLVERLLTESRAVWLYLRMLTVPDLAVLGFHHDDIPISRGLLTPWTTLPALIGWMVAIPLAVLGARRWPVAAFGILFFVAGHALESTIFPLELVFEHRNYLPALGPLFAFGWWLTVAAPAPLRRVLPLLAAAVLVLLAAVTHLRALDWSDGDRLAISEVDHHPKSPRANFRVAQLLINQLRNGEDQAQIYRAAHYHLVKIRTLDPDNINALFGLIYLDFYAERDPSPQLIDTLIEQLRSGPLGPTKLSISQLSFLVRWQMADGKKFTHEQALRILKAMLDNPAAESQVRAATFSALRAYHDRVLGNAQSALPYAHSAVRAWPQRWLYHYRLVDLLLRMDRKQEARMAFEDALRWPSAALNPTQRDQLAAALARATGQKPSIGD